MRNKSKKHIFISFIVLALFLIDAWVKITVLHSAPRVLWYSTLGLLLSAVALLVENSILITTAICALFVLEGFWTLGFLYFFAFHGKLMQFSAASFSLDFRQFSSIVTLYHLLFVPTVIYLYLHLKKVSKYGWVGALLFALTVGFLTYIFNDGSDNVNCVYTVRYCVPFLAPLYNIPNPARILAMVLILTLFIYIPTNLVLWKLRRKLK